MPEGDTIFRAATALRKALVGARVTQFRSEKLGRGPVGERIEDVSAKGKNLLVRFEKGRTLRTHMRMRGSWHIYRAGERWRRPGFHARLELHADNGFVAVCFAAPVVEWLQPWALAHRGRMPPATPSIRPKRNGGYARWTPLRWSARCSIRPRFREWAT